MIESTQCFFLNPYFKISFLKSDCAEIPVRMTYFCTGPSHDSWLTRPSYLRPALSEFRAVPHCVDSGAGEHKIEVFCVLRYNVLGCNNEYSIRHLLPTPEPQRINVNFGLKGMRLSRSTFLHRLRRYESVRANHSWNSFIYRRSEYKGVTVLHGDPGTRRRG